MGGFLLRPLEATADADVLKRLGFPGRVMGMDTTPFDLTPEQKGMLASLSHETGKPLPALLAAIAAALEELQEQREHLDSANGETAVSVPQPRSRKSFGEIAAELLADVPEEVFDRLPTDGAAQHDHYIYGTPKRPT